MSTLRITTSLSFHTVTCWAREGCGVQFALDDTFYRSIKEGGSTFWCPRGHRLAFGESELSKIQKQLESAQLGRSRALDQLESERRSHIATKGHLTRTKKKLEAGQCPVCEHRFPNLGRHIKAKHPDFCHTEIEDNGN